MKFNNVWKAKHPLRGWKLEITISMHKTGGIFSNRRILNFTHI
jgi:hypothetical protein